LIKATFIGGPMHGRGCDVSEAHFGPNVWVPDPQLLPEVVVLTHYRRTYGPVPVPYGELLIYEPDAPA
jgi:hypothetical protein